MSLLIGDQINVGYFFIPKEVVSLSWYRALNHVFTILKVNNIDYVYYWRQTQYISRELRQYNLKRYDELLPK
jgi:hypothetical protein